MTPHKQTFTRPVGRPSSITPEIVGKLEWALEHDATVTQACSHAGIHRSTYYQHLKENPEFSDKMDAARARLFLRVKSLVISQILKEKDAQLGLKWLERRERDRYSTRAEMRHQEPPQSVDHLSEARRRAAKYEAAPQN